MAGKRSILIVEDDAALRETLAEQLADDHGFSASTVAELGAANKIINEDGRPFDAVILDIGMSDGDGCQFCDRIRRQGRQIPIIILTGSDSEADVIRGLEAGANDYVVKPFRMNELVARLRAQLRLFESSEDAVLFVGPYRFHPSKKMLQDPAQDRRIRLTGTETAILKSLHRADNRAVDRQILLHEVWGFNSAVSTHTLETHIYRLRQKMERDPKHPTLLLTESGGYRLQADVGDPSQMTWMEPRERPSQAAA
jgi:DNA-binding response OmpR family regulator